MSLKQQIEAIVGNDKNQFGIFCIILVALTLTMMAIYYPLTAEFDIYFHFERFNALIDALKDGRYPHYIDYKAIDGYGYLTRVFYCDVILIPFALIGILTGSVIAYQVLIFTITILCGLFTYKATKRIFDNNYIALVSALLYTFCFYRLLDIYNRGALGESISFTFIPLIIWGVYEIVKGDYKRKWYILTIGYTLLIFTHVISSLIMAIVTLVLLAVGYKSLWKEPKRLLFLAISALVTIVLVSGYVLPMIEQLLSDTFYYISNEKRMTNPPQGQPALAMIWSLFCGVMRPRQSYSTGTGLLLTFILMTRIFLVGKRNKSVKKADILLILGIVFFFLMSSLYPWQTSPFSAISVIQIPWRLCIIISLFFAMAGAVYFSQMLKNMSRKVFGIGFIIIITIAIMVGESANNKGIFHSFNPHEKASVSNNYLQVGMEYLPDRVPDPAPVFFRARGNDSIASAKGIEIGISNFKRDKGTTSFDLKTTEISDVLELPLIYYKGYKATIDQEEIPVLESHHGLIEITAIKSGKVEVYYVGTTMQHISFWVSALSIIAFAIYIFAAKRKYKLHLSVKE